jgi:hypothetical protein
MPIWTGAPASTPMRSKGITRGGGSGAPFRASPGTAARVECEVDFCFRCSDGIWTWDGPCLEPVACRRIVSFLKDGAHFIPERLARK